jgi:hypothetical protein
MRFRPLPDAPLLFVGCRQALHPGRTLFPYILLSLRTFCAGAQVPEKTEGAKDCMIEAFCPSLLQSLSLPLCTRASPQTIRFGGPDVQIGTRAPRSQ